MKEKDKDIIKSIGVKLFTKKSLFIYNNLCSNCRHKVRRNPKLSYKKYCKKCKNLAQKVWKDYI